MAANLNVITRKPEVSLGLGLGVATLVYAMYQRLPGAADQRVSPVGDEHLEAVRKQNAWAAAAVVSGVSLVAKDPTIFIVGGLTIVTLDWLTRVNNWTNPVTGSSIDNPFSVSAPQEQVTMAPADVDYGGLSAVN